MNKVHNTHAIIVSYQSSYKPILIRFRFKKNYIFKDIKVNKSDSTRLKPRCKRVKLVTEKEVIEASFLPGLDIPDEVLENCLAFPSWVDLHTHLRQDPSGKWDYKETFAHAAEIALRNGFTRLLDMPNTPEACVDAKSLGRKQQLLKRWYDGPVRIQFYAGISPTTHPIQGQQHYKLFMAESVGDLFFDDWAQLEDQVAEYSQIPGITISFHCEDPQILEENAHRNLHWERRPREAEILAIGYVLVLCEAYGFHANICHVSTKEGVEMIRDAKAEGLQITAEASPGHLLFNYDKMPNHELELIIMNPPIRAEADNIALLEGLEDGTIDFIATDHAPHTLDEKKQGIPGLPYLSAMGGIVAHLINIGVDPKTIARTLAYNPRRFLGDESIEALTILNMNHEVNHRQLRVRSGERWSPFDYFTFPGRVESVVANNQLEPKGG